MWTQDDKAQSVGSTDCVDVRVLCVCSSSVINLVKNDTTLAHKSNQVNVLEYVEGRGVA